VLLLDSGITAHGVLHGLAEHPFELLAHRLQRFPSALLDVVRDGLGVGQTSHLLELGGHLVAHKPFLHLLEHLLFLALKSWCGHRPKQVA
jgi:hypothetical protein